MTLVPFYHPNFKKKYGRLAPLVKDRCDERIKMFINEPFAPILNNHPLHGEWAGYRSINITGDFRAIFKIKENLAIFVTIDTHTNLYD